MIISLMLLVSSSCEDDKISIKINIFEGSKELIERIDIVGNTITEENCGFLEVENGTGELSKEEFDSFIYDLTNFLVYVGEPIKATRERIGWYVVFYFLIFTALSALLYREFHKDYNKH